uniref:hypothetical protein n=1 Tax=Psychrobacter sp. TaxID=56811 RepID=UPI001597A78A|nr:hypothetical protein [Psychrobacter sp.]QJS05164.1 hypothetical protein [Psychrobacter sp.]
MLILIILLIASFFFPPLWIAFGIYLLFYILSAKNRRKIHVENAILSLIRTGNTDTVNFQNLYYEPVQKYAIEQGAEVQWGERSNPANDHMSFFLKVDDEEYQVFIHKEHDGSVSISADPKYTMEKIVYRDRQRLENLLKEMQKDSR